MRRRNAPAAWLPVCLVAALVTLAVPTSAAATRECFLLPRCTSVVGPWVVIPAADPIAVPAGVTVSCPDSGNGALLLAVGSDYELSGGGAPPPSVDRLLPGPGVGLITGGNAFFFAVAFSKATGSFRPHVGCIPGARRRCAARRPSSVGPASFARARCGCGRRVRSPAAIDVEAASG